MKFWCVYLVCVYTLVFRNDSDWFDFNKFFFLSFSVFWNVSMFFSWWWWQTKTRQDKTIEEHSLCLFLRRMSFPFFYLFSARVIVKTFLVLIVFILKRVSRTNPGNQQKKEKDDVMRTYMSTESGRNNIIVFRLGWFFLHFFAIGLISGWLNERCWVRNIKNKITAHFHHTVTLIHSLQPSYIDTHISTSYI